MAWGFRAASVAHIAGVFNTGPGSNDLHVAFGAALSSGDYGICWVTLYPTTGTATPSAPTCSDSSNGAWTLLDSTTYLDGTTHVWAGVFGKANCASGTPTVTVVSANTNQGAIGVAAYSGLTTTDGTLDGHAHATGTGGTAASGATGATTAANELVVGVTTDDGWSTATMSGAGAGFTQRDVLQGSALGEGQEQDEDSGASGSTPSNSLSSGHPGGSVTWACFVLVIPLSGAAAPVPINPPFRTLRGAGI